MNDQTLTPPGDRAPLPTLTTQPQGSRGPDRRSSLNDVDDAELRALIQRYDAAGPRYTSYPTAPVWREDFGPTDHAAQLAAAAAHPGDPLSVYAHLPFCEEMCTYCGCNVVITRDHSKADTYLDHLCKELVLAADLLGDRRGLAQLHWGGGTPTFLDERQLERLLRALTDRFTLLPGAEVAVEIDPVVTRESQLRLLRQLGFNRLSLGVQDFDPQVQEAVHRVQSPERTRDVLDLARSLGYGGVNFDLIYGLPYQTLATWERTMERVVALRPDRLAIYSFAFVPEVRPHQKRLPVAALPTGEDKLGLFLLAYRMLTAAGYHAIGMDHFALPEDELALAQERRSLWRNFQGYTVKAAGDVLALGVTGISDVQGAFAQTTRPLSHYYEAVSAGRFATERGVRLTDDDQRRRALITQLMCNFWVDLRGHSGVAPNRLHEEPCDQDYFAPELAQLDGFRADGLLRLADGQLEVTPLGRLFVRNIAMVFDAYLKHPQARPTFSRTV